MKAYRNFLQFFVSVIRTCAYYHILDSCTLDYSSANISVGHATYAFILAICDASETLAEFLRTLQVMNPFMQYMNLVRPRDLSKTSMSR